jgi:hypothetical protein
MTGAMSQAIYASLAKMTYGPTEGRSTPEAFLDALNDQGFTVIRSRHEWPNKADSVTESESEVTQ